jgi:NhaP-type Na+/H+ or K+/H+ antiporter
MIDPSVLVIAGLVLIVLVAAFSRRTGIASPLILLVVGVALGYLPGVPAVIIPHEWILAGVLPPLLYASAVNLPTADIRRNIQSIGSLSIVLVIVSTAITGWLLFALFKDLNVYAALAVGAVISPTDAIAATAVAQRFGLPERILTVLEGESLVNDATALVLLRSFTAAAGVGAVNVLLVGGQFLYAVVAGAAIGLVAGFATVALRARLSDPVLTTTISFVVPFIAYLPAERIGASGVLATVVAGLVTRARGGRLFDASQRVSDHTNWRTVQFVLEHAVFLVMGLEFRHLVAGLGKDGASLLVAIGVGVLLAVLLFAVRALYLAAELPLLRRREQRALQREQHLEERAERLAADDDSATGRQADRRDRAERMVARERADLAFLRENGPSWRGSLIISWSGMRGVVTLAAAQSLPEDFPYRPLLVIIAFTVAVVTLLGFGGTLPLVIRATRIRGTDQGERRTEVRELLDQVTASSLSLLDDPEQTMVRGKPADPRVVEMLRERYGRSPADVAEPDEHPDTGADLREQYAVLRRRMRQAAREELLDARAVGTFSTRAISAAQGILDFDDAREDRIVGRS